MKLKALLLALLMTLALCFAVSCEGDKITASGTNQGEELPEGYASMAEVEVSRDSDRVC